MSLPWGSVPGIALLAPVTTVAQAAAAAAAGAALVDAGRDGALVPAIRRAVGGVRVCGQHETADLVRDAGLAARSGAALICPGPDAAAAAVRRGVAAERILVQAAPAGIEAAVRPAGPCSPTWKAWTGGRAPRRSPRSAPGWARACSAPATWPRSGAAPT